MQKPTKRQLIIVVIFIFIVSFVAFKRLWPLATCHTPGQPTCLTTRGIVTEIAPDCGTSSKLVEGKIVVYDRGLCDGGGFITVNNVLIQYQSGNSFVYFSSDVGDLKPGDTAVARYVMENGNAQTSCNRCGITKL